MFNKNVAIVAVAGTQDYGVRYMYVPTKKIVAHQCYDDGSDFQVNGAGESVALQIAARTMNQYADAIEDGEFRGNVALVMPRNAAIRARTIRGLLRNGVGCEEVAEQIAARVAQHYTMNDVQLASINAFARAMARYMDSEGNLNRIHEYDAFNLHHWRLEVGEGVELEEGQVLNFVAQDNAIVALDGAIKLETNGASYVGEHKVVLVNDGINGDGTARMVWAIERTGESQRLKNVQKIWDKTLNLFNAEDDIDTLEDVDEDAISSVEEEDDIDDIEDMEAVG